MEMECNTNKKNLCKVITLKCDNLIYLFLMGVDVVSYPIKLPCYQILTTYQILKR